MGRGRGVASQLRAAAISRPPSMTGLATAVSPTYGFSFYVPAEPFVSATSFYRPPYLYLEVGTLLGILPVCRLLEGLFGDRYASFREDSQQLSPAFHTNKA